MSSWNERLGRLFLAHRGRLEALVRRRTGDRETAADLVQEAFARLLASGAAGTPEDDTRRLYAIARNATIDHGRAATRRAAVLASLVPQQFRLEEPSAERGYEARQALAGLREALRSLPARTQDVFLLRRVHGLSHEEIARTLSISRSTVEKHLVRAVRHCQARLDRDAGSSR